MPELPQIPELEIIGPEAGVLHLRLARAPLNLLSQKLRRALGTTFAAFRGRDDIRAVVLSGTGQTFCAGADMTEFTQRFERHVARAQGANGHRMMRNLLRAEVPTVAAVEGNCLGGGYELALACDWIVAGRGARLGLPEINRGIFPGTAGIPLLARRIGPVAARMFILRGEIVTAEAAHQRGLLDQLVPDGEALSQATALARDLAAAPVSAVAAIRRLADHDFHDAFDRHLMAEIDAFEDIFQTADAREGAAAFFDKRPPQWVLPSKGTQQ